MNVLQNEVAYLYGALSQTEEEKHQMKLDHELEKTEIEIRRLLQ